MLKEHPGHIDRLQKALNTVIEKPSKVTPPIELAIWALESRLETFISEARNELRIAEENGDAQAIATGKQKVLLMLDCRSSPSAWKMKNLMEYFDKAKVGGVMANEADQLPKDLHDRILREEVLTLYNLHSLRDLPFINERILKN